MKSKTVNKFKRAGVWNIVCGVLYTLAYIGVFVLLWISAIGGAEELLAVFLYSIAGIYLWEGVFMTFPFLMILAGAEMCSKHKKGAGVRAFIVFNILMKLLSIFFNAIFACLFFTSGLEILYGCGALLTLSGVLTLISVVIDVPALFSKQKVLQNK